MVEGADENGAMDGDGKNDEGAKDGIEGGHGERVVAGCDTFAKDDVDSETDRA